MSRHDRIREQLNRAQSAGVVADWYASNPNGEKRWRVWGPGFDRVYGTREVEAFLLGVEHARSS